MNNIDLENVSSNLAKVKKEILQFAKTIKSNDVTFGISALPNVSEDLDRAMEEYVEVSRKIHASQKADRLLDDEIDESDNQSKSIDPEAFVKRLKKARSDILKKELKNWEADARRDLERMLHEDEILCEESSNEVPKDPITKTLIKDAVKSNKCGHTYDKETFENYMRQKEANKKRIQCPVAGCTNKDMSRNELVPDDEINARIRASK